MTNEEAKKICDDYISGLLGQDMEHHLTRNQMKQALNISMEQAEAFGIVISAFDKEIPKKVRVEKYIYTECPNGCGYELSEHHGDGYYSISEMPDRCPRCGQILDWGDVEGE